MAKIADAICLSSHPNKSSIHLFPELAQYRSKLFVRSEKQTECKFNWKTTDPIRLLSFLHESSQFEINFNSNIRWNIIKYGKRKFDGIIGYFTSVREIEFGRYGALIKRVKLSRIMKNSNFSMRFWNVQS